MVAHHDINYQLTLSEEHPWDSTAPTPRHITRTLRHARTTRHPDQSFHAGAYFKQRWNLLILVRFFVAQFVNTQTFTAVSISFPDCLAGLRIHDLRD